MHSFESTVFVSVVIAYSPNELIIYYYFFFRNWSSEASLLCSRRIIRSENLCMDERQRVFDGEVIIVYVIAYLNVHCCNMKSVLMYSVHIVYGYECVRSQADDSSNRFYRVSGVREPATYETGAPSQPQSQPRIVRPPFSAFDHLPSTRSL